MILEIGCDSDDYDDGLMITVIITLMVMMMIGLSL